MREWLKALYTRPHPRSSALSAPDTAKNRRDLRQSKIENLRVSSFRDENVGRFDVSVDDAFSVSGIEGVGDFKSQRQYPFDLQRLAANPMLQGHPFEILHCDERLPIVLADFVNRANVGVVQS